ncbi:serine hydrolase domain-containing protein [Fimbriimonas ginsengisoli]|uniref:Beta-lactamase n=1 Tax=Fimbriimonas ginsengisoli Gsoil 348 TaxID=661478 RepID=A0A068NJS0_FIMGI|nr:serine hydrolase domain-containing protein [Fimbriimonas ginsengisoli]AIE83751.1 Beta-lactamase [Fimbriimonas ginsengisoli Gsoil 348]
MSPFLLLPLIAMSPDAAGFDSARLALIPPRMQKYVDEGAVAGTVLLVRRHGRTAFFDARGWANLETKHLMRRDTIFQIMSMTKPVTAIAVVMCAEAGLLNLDDPVDKYFPLLHRAKVRQEDGTLSAAESVPTIRQLLTHTAGFGSNDPAGMDDDGKRKLTLAEYAGLLAKEPLVGSPGERIRYSGPGFSLLGRIVEIASGMPLERFESERIFRPLGMKDTFFFAPKNRYARLAYTYVRERGKLVPLDANPFREGARFANPAGGLYSTADDMATLLQCVSEGGFLHGYRLLSPAAVDAMTAVQTGSLQMDGSDAQGFGLGFAVVKSPAGQVSLKPVGSFGHTGAFGTEFWTDRKRGIVAVFMAQGLDNVSPVRKTFNTMLNAAFTGP